MYSAHKYFLVASIMPAFLCFQKVYAIKVFDCKAANTSHKCTVSITKNVADLQCPNIQTKLPCNLKPHEIRCTGNAGSTTVDFYEADTFSHFTSWLYISKTFGTTRLYDCVPAEFSL